MASRVQLSGPQEAEKYVLHMVRLATWLNSPNLNIDPVEDCLIWQCVAEEWFCFMLNEIPQEL